MNNDFNFDFSWDNLSANLQNNINAKKYEKDTRFWKLSKDESGNGTALIRLLTDATGTPMVKLFHYSIKKYNPGNPKAIWFIANSPESVNLPCPVKEHYQHLMAEGTTEATKDAGNFKRQTKFVANIMVVKDPANPDNDGKVFLWEFGTKMKDKIMGWLNPSDEEKAMGEEAKALFNPLDGNNIKLKIKRQGEFFTYDSTEVSPSKTALFSSKDEAVEFITTKTYKLNEFLEPEFYEDYVTLKERFSKFLGVKTDTTTAPVSVAKAEPIIDTGLDATPAKSTPAVDTEDDAWLDEL